MAKRACLIVEGFGDTTAVPLLLRRVLHEVVGDFVFQLASNPIRGKDIPCIRRPGQLEKFLRYACMREDCDSVILLLDCDDDCPVEIVAEFGDRARTIADNCQKPIAFGFFKKEFETLFLYSIDSIADSTSLPGSFDVEEIKRAGDLETVRGAKGMFRRALPTSSYKETRDQPKYVNALDLALLQDRSRSYQHVVSLVNWIVEAVPGDSLIYPDV